jgi:hypothetical protein
MNAGNPLGLGLVWNSFHQMARVTSYTAYLRDRKGSPNLIIRPDSPVDRILVENHKAVGLVLRGGETGQLFPSAFLACFLPVYFFL